MAKRVIEVQIVGNASSLKRAVGESNTVLGTMGKSFGGAAKSAIKFAAVTAGIAGVGAAVASVGRQTIEFDKGMRNVNSIAQLSEGQLKSLEKQVLSLAGKTAQAPTTLAGGLYDLVSSGFNAKQSMTIVASSAKAATAGLTTTEVATKAVAAVLNAYHRPAKDAANISDVLFQTVNRGVITFEDLANNIGTVLPFASSLGVGLNQVGAAISTMTKQGISGELSITFLKNAMVSFLKPSKGMEAAIKATGFASGEALVKAKGFQGALDAVRGTTDGSKKAMAALFPNIRSLTAALALTGKNAHGAAGDLAAFKNVGGATDKALSQQSKSISYQWNKVKATFSALAISLGQQLVPAVSSALQAVLKFVNQMKDGEGAGGRFAAKIKSIWNNIQPLISAFGHAAAAVASFVGQHPAVQKMAAALIAVGLAVKTIKFGGAITGLSTLLSNMRRAGPAAESSGGAIGKSFATKFTAVAAAGVVGWDIGTILRAKSGVVRDAGNFLGKTVAQAFGVGVGSFQNKVDSMIGQVQDKVNAELGRINSMSRPKGPHGHTGGSPKAKGSSVMAGIASVGGPVAHASQHFSKSQLMALWVQAGGDPKVANTAAAIALAESGGQSTARNSIGATGLWQIYNGANTSMGLKDPMANARAAVAKYNAAHGFTPWTTFTGADTGPGGGPGPKTYLNYLKGGGAGGRSGPSAATLRKWMNKARGIKGGDLRTVNAILAGRSGPGHIALGLPSRGGYAGDVYQDDAYEAGLQNAATALQGRFDAQDRAAQGRGLRGALKGAARAVRNAQPNKGEKPQDFEKRMGGLVAKVREAKKALFDFNKEGARAKALHQIDLKIKGVEDAKAFKNAIADIRKGLHDAAKQAADAFRTMREKQISDAHDAALATVASSKDAQELASLQAQDAQEQDAKTTEQLNQDLADAIASGDKKAQKDAQDAIDAYARQKREDQLQANIDAATKAADDAQQTALDGLDKEVQDFQNALDAKLQAEADQLEKRKMTYKTFLADVDNIAKGYGLSAMDVVGASADQEAAIGDPKKVASNWSGGKVGLGWYIPSLPGRAAGGPVRKGQAYIVGENRPEVFIPGQNGRISPNVAGGGDMMLTKYGDVKVGSNVDAQRQFQRLAFRIATS